MHLFCILICIPIFSCRFKKEMTIWGFAYKGEVIIVKNGADTILNYKVEGQADSNSICHFTRKI